LESVLNVAAPLLAGFSMTLAGFIVTGAESVRWPGAALLASVISMVLLVNAVQIGAWARVHSVTPDDLRTWFDDTEEERAYYIIEMRRQNVLYRRYARRARAAYGAGLVMLLVAVALTVAPSAGAPQYWAQWAAFGIAVSAAGLEVFWMIVVRLVAGRTLQERKPYLPLSLWRSKHFWRRRVSYLLEQLVPKP